MKSRYLQWLTAGALVVLILATVGAYVRFLFPARTRLVGGQIASSIDRHFVTPIDVTRRFAHTAPAIYVTATVARAPLGTKIRGEG